jgi:NTE family protein
MRSNIGLVLTGGGARAAYQAGVLKGIAEILGNHAGITAPFNILVGTSAGAINSSLLAAKAKNFQKSVDHLCQLWSELRTEQVVRSDFASLSALGIRWIRDLSLGGILGQSRSTYLLDAQPLWGFLAERIDFNAIKTNLSEGILRGLAVSATNYNSGTAVTFFDGAPEIQPWVRNFRLGQRTELTLKHVLASAAIPIFFQPVRLYESYYGDGCVRMTTPLSPAIHLGADRILAIGIRHQRPEDMTLELNQHGMMSQISLVDIAGVMLNAAFLDALDADIERMRRINITVSLLSEKARDQHPYKLRRIPLLALRPSQDLGTLASEQFERFPGMLRYLLKGIGASTAKGWDVLSYLAFDEAYTQRLIELGQADALAQHDEIEQFFTQTDATDKPKRAGRLKDEEVTANTLR